MQQQSSLSHRVTIAVLAGGRGVRLGGADKGLVRTHDRPLIRHVLDAVTDTRPVVIVANRNVEAYQTLGHTVISDPWPDFRGPLAGMLAALSVAVTPWVQILPCDGLSLPVNLADVLLVHAVRFQVPAAYPVVNGQGHFVCALLHRDLMSHLATALDEGERAPRRWLETVNARPVEFADAEATYVWSVNDPADLAAARRRG